MPGGLLNLAAVGNQNILVHGNPTKTFFKSTYAKHTNFGLQKFRIDYQGQKDLQLNSVTNLLFKVPRYADLLMDIYLVFDLPDIWSSVLAPTSSSDISRNNWTPYEFKWIKNIGTNIIKEVKFLVGGHVIQRYTGSYMQNVIDRDFDETKKKLFDIMTGNIDELNDPAKFYNNKYPNAINFNNNTTNNILPSIKGRRIYVPINIWFTLMSKMAFPLISLQYSELHIEFTLRPLNELFVVRDIDNPDNNDFNNTKYIAANQNINRFQLYRFLQEPPPDVLKGTDDDKYQNKINTWKSNTHILANYCFLDNDEVKVFTSKPQEYLIKEFRDYNYYELVGSNKILIDTNGLVSNFMFYLQRNDIIKTNEWSNYSNWEYENKIPNTPQRNIQYKNNYITDNKNLYDDLDSSINTVNDISLSYLMYFNSNYLADEQLNIINQKNILNNFAILFDGKYRENQMEFGVYNYVDNYNKSSGKGKDGLYFYNFGLSSNPYSNQPSGSVNLSKFNKIEFEINLINSPISDEPQYIQICDEDGLLLGVEKSSKHLHKYTFNLTVQEERYNKLIFTNGNAQLMFT